MKWTRKLKPHLYSTVSAELAADITDLVEARLRKALPTHLQPPFVVGLCGAQGSGKSTVARALQECLGRGGIAAAVLSLDDLYLPREERVTLTAVQPLLSTRGVPGTHEVNLGLAILDACGRIGMVALRRFSNADDTRCPHET